MHRASALSRCFRVALSSRTATRPSLSAEPCRWHVLFIGVCLASPLIWGTIDRRYRSGFSLILVLKPIASETYALAAGRRMFTHGQFRLSSSQVFFRWPKHGSVVSRWISEARPLSPNQLLGAASCLRLCLHSLVELSVFSKGAVVLTGRTSRAQTGNISPLSPNQLLGAACCLRLCLHSLVELSQFSKGAVVLTGCTSCAQTENISPPIFKL